VSILFYEIEEFRKQKKGDKENEKHYKDALARDIASLYFLFALSRITRAHSFYSEDEVILLHQIHHSRVITMSIKNSTPNWIFRDSKTCYGLSCRICRPIEAQRSLGKEQVIKRCVRSSSTCSEWQTQL